MSARLARVEFNDADEFNLAPRFERRDVQTRFAKLQESLVDEVLEEAETAALHPELKNAANEAAGIAWTTEFPLLVFPALFEEFARRERSRHYRQEQIKAKTECLLEVA